MCNCCNTRQCLTSKSFCLESKEIICRVNFTGSVAQKAERCIFSIHTFSIIHDLNQCLTGIFDVNVYFFSTGINGILNQLLHNRSRPLDYLPCSNLIGNMIRKYRNDALHIYLLTDYSSEIHLVTYSSGFRCAFGHSISGYPT